jgi:Flp pilus assembly protein TadG
MNRRSDNGVIVVVVAACLFVLTAFSAIVIDQGVFWVARSQAQNAADAAAMAGVLALKDDPSPTGGATATAVAQAFVGQNPIWGEAVQPSDIQVSPPSVCPPPNVSAILSCITVTVYRGVRDASLNQHTNYLPTFFANLLGIHQQGISATATASYLPTPGLVR